MSGQSGDSSVIGDWVRKQLEAGDDPEVLKTVLKNRGMDPDIVKRILSSVKKNPPAKKQEASEAEPKKTFTNDALKSEVEKIFSGNLSGSASLNMADNGEIEISGRTGVAGALDTGASHKKPIKENVNKYALKKMPVKCIPNAKIDEPQEIVESEPDSIPKEESIFSLFFSRAREYFSGIKIGSPKITEYIFNTRIVVLTGIAVAILLIALFASFGLNWYADWAAQKVLSGYGP